MSMDIEALAAERWFSELTDAEQQDALSELRSAEAYDAVRATILRSCEALAPDIADPLPRAADTADLRAAMRQRAAYIAAARPSLLARLLEYRVPAYQPALLAAAMLVLFLVWRPQPGSVVPAEEAVHEKIVYVPVVDTAVRGEDNENDRLDREKIVQEVTDSLLRALDQRERKGGRVASLKSRDVRQAPVADMPVRYSDGDERNREGLDAHSNVYVGLANLPQLDVQRKGKTFAEDSGAARFNAPVWGERN